jgi:hypothetical protein
MTADQPKTLTKDAQLAALLDGDAPSGSPRCSDDGPLPQVLVYSWRNIWLIASRSGANSARSRYRLFAGANTWRRTRLVSRPS